jgi:N-acetyl-alpha-D-muramate 1-phosphate uridylyltransferase
MSAFPKKAMVLAAGLGLRMRPLTEHLPKPLVRVADITLIDRALDWLSVSGVSEAVVNSHYLASQLEAHLARRNAPKIHISREETVLETGGGIKQALSLLGNDAFFSVNSDVICLDGASPALQRLYQRWDEKEMDALLLVQQVEKTIGYEGVGDFFVHENGAIRRRGEEKNAPFVFTGVQLLHPRLFTGAPQGAFSLNLLYNRGMGSDGILKRIYALPHDGEWLHIGDAKGLTQAEQFFARVA